MPIENLKKEDKNPQTKSKFIPKIKWIILSLAVLIISFLVIDYLRYQTKPRPLVGQVINSKNEPIEGAIIISGDKASESKANGIFRIQAKKTDTLKVIASGYKSQTIKGENPTAILTPLNPASVRVVVVDRNNKEISKTLVYRLDPNTSVPVGIRLTDKSGSAMFTKIPSGQAAFVALHPDYGVGWVETALEEGGYSRPVIRLQKSQGQIKFSQRAEGFIKKAYAQSKEPTPKFNLSSGKTIWEIKDVQKIGENEYEITDKSITLINVDAGKFSWDEYTRKIDIFEKEREALEKKGLDYNEAKALQGFLNQQGLSSPVQPIRITPYSKDVSNTYIEEGSYHAYNPLTDKPISGLQPGEVYVSKTNVYRVEIKNANPMDTMVVLQRRHSANREIQMMNPNNYYATSVSEIPRAEAEVAKTGGIVIFDDPRRTVCCRGREVDSKSTSVLSESSSSNTPLSPITVRDINTDKISYTYNPVIYDFKPDLTAFQKIKQDNPRLEFTDKDGTKISILDIAPPHPDDAPIDFIAGGFFDTASDARDAYRTGSSQYQENWNKYLYMKANNTLLKDGEKGALDLYKNLRQKIGFESGFRLNPQSYNQTASQQNSATESNSSENSTDSKTNSPDSPRETSERTGSTEIQPDDNSGQLAPTTSQAGDTSQNGSGGSGYNPGWTRSR